MSALVHCARRRAAPKPFDPRLRARIETTIERLIATLDAIDGDPDLEDGADTEPNCGGYYTAPHLDECEAEDEGDELDHGEFDEAQMADLWSARFGHHVESGVGRFSAAYDRENGNASSEWQDGMAG